MWQGFVLAELLTWTTVATGQLTRGGQLSRAPWSSEKEEDILTVDMDKKHENTVPAQGRRGEKNKRPGRGLLAYACNMMAAHWVFTATPLLVQDFSLSHRIYSNSLTIVLSILCPDARAISLKHNFGHSTPQRKNLQWCPLPTTSKNALSSFQEFASPIKVLTPQELAQMPPGCRSLKLSLVVFSHT